MCFYWKRKIERNSAQAPQNESDEKPFFCQTDAIFWEKMVYVVIDRNFALFLKGFEDFS